MTDDEPNSVSMEDAMQATRDALGYRDNLKPQRELIPNLPSRLRWRSLTSAWTLPVSRSIPANRLSVPWRLYS